MHIQLHAGIMIVFEELQASKQACCCVHSSLDGTCCVAAL